MLIVSAEPYRKGGMDADSLATWYGRHGFVTIQDEPRIMARACHG